MFSDIKPTSPSFGIGGIETANRVRTPASPPKTSKSKTINHIQKNKTGGDASMNPKAHNAIIVFDPPGAPEAVKPAEESVVMDTEIQEILGSRNIRFISPREMAELALDLYGSGFLSWDEYAALAFQAELQPAYNRTIGTLTGHKAEPDRPRDFIRKWERRLAFEREHMPDKQSLIEISQRITMVLRELERPLKLVS